MVLVLARFQSALEEPVLALVLVLEESQSAPVLLPAPEE